MYYGIIRGTKNASPTSTRRAKPLTSCVSNMQRTLGCVRSQCSGKWTILYLAMTITDGLLLLWPCGLRRKYILFNNSPTHIPKCVSVNPTWSLKSIGLTVSMPTSLPLHEQGLVVLAGQSKLLSVSPSWWPHCLAYGKHQPGTLGWWRPWPFENSAQISL